MKQSIEQVDLEPASCSHTFLIQVHPVEREGDMALLYPGDVSNHDGLQHAAAQLMKHGEEVYKRVLVH